MSRLALRTRLTLVFSLAMAIVVAALGLFVDLRVRHSLQRTIDDGLRARSADIANLENQADNGLSSRSGPFAGPTEGFGQLIDPSRGVYDATPGLRGRPLIGASALARARRGPYFVDLSRVRGAPARVLVAPVQAQGQRFVLVVGASLADERRTLSELRTGLLFGGPIALLLTSLAGFLLAGAALRPVERMRSRAASISPAAGGERLPVPPANDEIARLGRTLNEMLGRLEQARVREREFLGDASHELRTPLSLLKAELELALDEPRSAAELRAALRSAGEEADRLIQLAEDLLLLAQTDRGVLPLRIAPIEAGELAHRLARRFAPRAAAQYRSLDFFAEPGLTLHGDALRLEQALGNLLDNALRHGAGRVTLEIRADSTAAVELHVRDQGGGIPDHFRTRAFERFTRADSSRHGGGSGLGLAIVAAVAGAHHGEVRIGEGADVYLRLPRTVDWRPGPPPALHPGDPGPAVDAEPTGAPHATATRRLSSVLAGLRLSALGLVVAGLFLAGMLVVPHSPERLRHILGLGSWMPVLAMLAYALATCAFVPGAVLAGASGMVFGTALGTALAICSATVGAALAFTGARLCARASYRTLAGERLRAWSQRIERRSFLSVLYARLVPGAPFALVSYAAGLTRIRLLAFAAATAIAGAPRAFAYASLGGNLRDYTSPQSLLAFGLLAIMTIAGALLLWRSRRPNRSASDHQRVRVLPIPAHRSGKPVSGGNLTHVVTTVVSPAGEHEPPQ